MNFEAVSKIGLSPLEGISKMTIHRQVPQLQVPPQFKKNYQYRIVNENGQILYFAFEDIDWAWHCCERITHTFSIRICDISGSLVFVLESEEVGRSSRTVSIRAQDGSLIGSVYHSFLECCQLSFTVHGPNSEVLYRIETGSAGGFIISVMGVNQWMPIGQIVGHLETIISTYKFDIDFPPNLPVEHKACLLAAFFAVDMRCYVTYKRQRW